MLRSHKLALISSFATLLLTAPGCGTTSLDDIFAEAGSAGAGAGGKGGEGGATGGGGSGGEGAGTTGTGTTSGTTDTGTTSGTTSTPSGVEDCTDGVDNDGDGATDCADSDCNAGFECLPGIPATWDGVYDIVSVGFNDGLPPCDDGSNGEVFYAEPAGPAECTACSCGDLMGAQCSPPAFSCWPGSTGCGGTEVNLTATMADGQCHKPGNLSQGFTPTLSCKLTEASQPSSPGTCAPSAVDFPNKDTWNKQVESCDLAIGGGCNGTQVCAPKSADGGPRCIRKAGDNACPAGAYSVKTVVYTDADDTRSCTSCTCGAGNATCSGESVTVYDSDQCGNQGNENPAVIDSATCDNVSSLLDFGSWSMKATLAQAKGSCPPGGGEPDGAVTPKGTVTYCCLP
ncbi:MAG: hypothetical protein R3B70_37300 [Polyangiaceae bacterium]